MDAPTIQPLAYAAPTTRHVYVLHERNLLRLTADPPRTTNYASTVARSLAATIVVFVGVTVAVVAYAVVAIGTRSVAAGLMVCLMIALATSYLVLLLSDNGGVVTTIEVFPVAGHVRWIRQGDGRSREEGCVASKVRSVSRELSASGDQELVIRLPWGRKLRAFVGCETADLDTASHAIRGALRGDPRSEGRP